MPQAVTPEAEAAEVVLPEVRVGFDLTIDLSEAIRGCVVFLQGPPYHLDLSEFAEEACSREIERLRQEAPAGGRFGKASPQLAVRWGSPEGMHSRLVSGWLG